jgi:hypothetical protein
LNDDAAGQNGTGDKSGLAHRPYRALVLVNVIEKLEDILPDSLLCELEGDINIPL